MRQTATAYSCAFAIANIVRLMSGGNVRQHSINSLNSESIDAMVRHPLSLECSARAAQGRGQSPQVDCPLQLSSEFAVGSNPAGPILFFPGKTTLLDMVRDY